MATKIITEEEYVAADGDPNKMPSLGGAPGNSDSSDVSANLADIRPPGTIKIAGMECRDFNVGVMAILEDINHPLFSETENGEADLSTTELAVLLFVLVHPDIGELVDWAEAGTLRRQAKIWSFEIGPDQMNDAEGELQKYIDDAGDEMQGQDVGGPPKKKTEDG